MKNLHLFKDDGSQRLLAEFPIKNWMKARLDTLRKKLKETGSTDRKRGSGRLKKMTEENVSAVEELVLSQEDQPQSHHSTRQIARETGLAQASMVRIIHHDLGLKCFKRHRGQELNEANRQARLSRSKMLLAKYSESDVNFVWFTNEKVFRWPRQEIHRTTDFTQLHRRRRSISLPNVLFVHDRPSVIQWWCQSWVSRS